MVGCVLELGEDQGLRILNSITYSRHAEYSNKEMMQKVN